MRLRLVMALGLVLFLMPAARAWDTATATSSDLPGAGPESGGCRLLATLEKPTVEVGEKVVLKLTLQNVSSAVRVFSAANPRTEFKLTVTDERGRGVRGNRNLYGGDLYGTTGYDIKPGQQFLEDYNVNSVFGDDIRKPGKYHITARTWVYGATNESPRPVIVSNAVVLTVVKAKPAKTPKGGKQ